MGGRAWIGRKGSAALLAAALAAGATPGWSAVLESEPNGAGDPPDPISLALPGGVVMRGEIAPGDVDYFSVLGKAGELLTVSVIEEGKGEFADPVLGIFQGGALLATDDDDGPQFLPSLRLVVPPGGGTFVIAVSGFGDSGFTGAHAETFRYQLVVAQPPPGSIEADEAGNAVTPESLGAGAFDAIAPAGAASLAGKLLAAPPGGTGDVDRYALPVEPGRTLSVSIFEDDEGSFEDPVVRVLPPVASGADPQDDDDGPGFLASLLADLGLGVAPAELWTVEVTRFRDEPGNDRDTPYTLVASLAGRLCDADGDGNVDELDIAAIQAARGSAVGPSDARDLDQDLVLTVLDSRACVAQCDNPDCSPACGLLGIEALLPLAWAWRRRRTRQGRHA